MQSQTVSYAPGRSYNDRPEILLSVVSFDVIMGSCQSRLLTGEVTSFHQQIE